MKEKKITEQLEFSRDILMQNIKKIRLDKGLNQSQFGDLFDPPADKSIVSRWEKGKSVPSADRLKKLSNIANISIYELLYGSVEVYVTTIISNHCKEQKISLNKESLQSTIDFFSTKKDKYPPVSIVIDHYLRFAPDYDALIKTTNEMAYIYSKIEKLSAKISEGSDLTPEEISTYNSTYKKMKSLMEKTNSIIKTMENNISAEKEEINKIREKNGL